MRTPTMKFRKQFRTQIINKIHHSIIKAVISMAIQNVEIKAVKQIMDKNSPLNKKLQNNKSNSKNK